MPGEFQYKIALTLNDFGIQGSAANNLTVKQDICATWGSAQTYGSPCLLQACREALLNRAALYSYGIAIVQIAIFDDRKLMLARLYFNIQQRRLPDINTINSYTRVNQICTVETDYAWQFSHFERVGL